MLDITLKDMTILVRSFIDDFANKWQTTCKLWNEKYENQSIRTVHVHVHLRIHSLIHPPTNCAFDLNSSCLVYDMEQFPNAVSDSFI